MGRFHPPTLCVVAEYTSAEIRTFLLKAFASCLQRLTLDSVLFRHGANEDVPKRLCRRFVNTVLVLDSDGWPELGQPTFVPPGAGFNTPTATIAAPVRGRV